MIVPDDQGHRFVIHDRNTIYAEGVDRTLEEIGLEVLKTPARVPQANSFCERLIGTIRSECLDFVIPITERHLSPAFFGSGSFITTGAGHIARPDPPLDGTVASNGHELPNDHRVVAAPVLSGLHHGYRLEAA